RALRQSGLAAKAAIPALVAALNVKDIAKPDTANSIRFEVIETLRVMGPEARRAVPTLTDILLDKDTDVSLSRVVAQTLGSIGPEAKQAVPALAHILSTKKGDIHLLRATATALGNIGPEAAPAVPALVDVLKDKRGRGRSPGTGGRNDPS